MLSDNYKHRAEVRASLANNQEWIDQYFGKILPMLTSQTNIGLISMDNGSKADIVYPDGQGNWSFLQLFNQSIFVQKEKVILNTKQQNIPAIFIEPK